MLVPNNNLFVLPQYPELGWNINPEHHVPENHHDNIFEEVEDNMQDQEEEMVVDSIVLNPSNASANLQNLQGEVNQGMVLGHNVVQVGQNCLWPYFATCYDLGKEFPIYYFLSGFK
jgi:hypothetical protein